MSLGISVFPTVECFRVLPPLYGVPPIGHFLGSVVSVKKSTLLSTMSYNDWACHSLYGSGAALAILRTTTL